MKKKVGVLSLLLMSVGLFSNSFAQDINMDTYPDKTLTMLVGYGPGGGNDTMAREMIKNLNQNDIVNQKILVENLPGASGVNAFIKTYKESKNNYQLLVVVDMGLPLANGAMDVEISEFKPIAQVESGTLVLMVSNDSPYDTVEEFLADLKEDPSQFIIGSAGSMTSSEPYRWYTIIEAINDGVAVSVDELNIVPQDGTASSIPGVLGGHLDVILTNPGSAVDHVSSGNAKVLAVLSEERLEAFPDAPTLKEVGLDIVHRRARGFWMGGEVSDEIVTYWEEKFKEASQTAYWQEYTEKGMSSNEFLDTEKYLDFLEKENKKFKEYIHSLDN